MKKNLIASVILAASLTLVGCEVFQKDAYDYMDEVQSTKLIDESTNGISLGDTSEKVEKELGKPRKDEKSESIHHLTYGNDELSIILENNKVIEYQINNSQYPTAKGVKVGNSKKEVIDRYGSNYYTNKDDDTLTNIGYFDKEEKKHIEFSLKNNQVIYIKVTDIS